jgi:glycosyltransferase involved in cell wall biosynthesis
VQRLIDIRVRDRVSAVCSVAVAGLADHFRLTMAGNYIRYANDGTVPSGRPIVVAQLVNCLGLGGTERQLVEHLRQLDARYTAQLMCLFKAGAFLGDLLNLSINPEEFSLRGSLLQVNTAVQAARIARRLRERQAQLLHCHDFYSNIVGSAAARLAGIPYIVSRRDLGLERNAARRQLLAWVTRQASHVLCNAEAVRTLVESEGVPRERISVVYNGLDLERFDQEAAKELTIPEAFLEDRAPTVVLAGNMQLAVKGHLDFLAAAALVARELPNTRFVLVGDGQLRARLEQQASVLGLRERVLFAGWRTDVPAILSRCTVAVSASYSEGLSNAIMEAMAARLPVVATAVGGTVELVLQERTGFLVPAGEPDRMAARVIELLRAPERARSMGEAGRRRIESEFAASLLGRRMAEVYDRMLGLRRELRVAA